VLQIVFWPYNFFIRSMLYDFHLSLLESAKSMNLLEHMKLTEDLHCFLCHHNEYVLLRTKNAYVSSHFLGILPILNSIVISRSL
jgi:hypothetical protein